MVKGATYDIHTPLGVVVRVPARPVTAALWEVIKAEVAGMNDRRVLQPLEECLHAGP